jgi:CubicO group peptidase (beta-lactamase class C family)
VTIDPEFVEQLVGEAEDVSPWSRVILVDREGETMFSEAFGYANQAEEIRNSVDTRFAQASGSKTFTAVAVAQLVEAGYFECATPMVNCLDLWPVGFDPSVTVHQLLSHTSGVPDYFDEKEQDDSGFFSLDRLPSRTALNYLTGESPNTPRVNLYTVPIKGQPDGGAFVTAPDMVSFWAALGSDQLIGPGQTETLLTPHAPTGTAYESYGYGLWVEHHGDRLVHHAEGGDPGVNFLSGIHLESGISVTVISNTDGGVGRVYKRIFQSIFH